MTEWKKREWWEPDQVFKMHYGVTWDDGWEQIADH